MKVVYRIIALILTLVSAVVAALLINVATRDGSTIKVVPFTLFAVGAALALIVALALWQRANHLKSSDTKEPPK